MGIGSVTSTNSMSGMQMVTASSTDPKIKNIQNEITDAKQQMQKLSTKDELSANDKVSERKKLQKEISDLNTELKQHQEELRKSQKREIMLAELREDQNPSKEEKTEDEIQAAQPPLDQTNEKPLPADEQQTA
ncbi:MAG: FlxA-like family protein, partial [Lachnospiraceae bacterium]|nr:FlxA-like family protein [Lachnospiraceae bacterium]